MKRLQMSTARDDLLDLVCQRALQEPAVRRVRRRHCDHKRSLRTGLSITSHCRIAGVLAAVLRQRAGDKLAAAGDVHLVAVPAVLTSNLSETINQAPEHIGIHQKAVVDVRVNEHRIAVDRLRRVEHVRHGAREAVVGLAVWNHTQSEKSTHKAQATADCVWAQSGARSRVVYSIRFYWFFFE